MEIFNGKKLGDTHGLVTIFIPRAGEPEFPQDLGKTQGEDFYLGADFYNWERVDTWCRQHNLPAVWANPLKFIHYPERLILLHAIHKKIPYPPEQDKLGSRMPLFGPEQGRLALKKFGSGVKPLFRRTYEVAEKCRFNFGDIVPKLPSDLFPTPLREVIKEELRQRKKLSWEERQRAPNRA